MDVAALILWLVTAVGGFVLLGTWLQKGGLRQQETGESRFPPALIFGHFLLAAAGLVVWILFVASDESSGLAWTAFVLLLPVALLGFAMLARWWSGRSALATAAEPHGTLGAPAATVAAEQRFPVPVVVAHGLLAVVTLVLVLLTAIDVS
jgi:hypothetical protein